MACPLFIPLSPLGEITTIAAPLGDLHEGRCSADVSANIRPEILRRCCNFGYARSQCERAAQSEADAVRLLVRAERGTTVEVAWAIERNHHPVAVGVIEIETGSAARLTDDILALQARACAAVYLRQAHGLTAPVDQVAVAAHQ